VTTRTTEPPLTESLVTPPRAARDEPSPAARRYEPGPVLARGAQGRVRRGADAWLGREVAIKEPVSPAAHSRLLSEALITARLQHPAIVPIYDAGKDDDGVPFCAMKLVDGRSLHDVIGETRTLDERLRLVPRVLTVAEAIAYAHSRGVIHRDLKPANVLVGPYGETVVIDWGLAKQLGGADDDRGAEAADPGGGAAPPADATEVGTVLGTPAYMAPEQARGEPVDARADVYALGAMLYHLLAGAPPYSGVPGSGAVTGRVLDGPPPPLRALARGLPRDLATIVDKAMAREPAERYASAADLAADLGRFTSGQLVAAHQYGAVARLVRFVRRHRAAVSIGTLAAAALAATILVSVDRVVAERDVAEDERRRAVAQRRAAEELVDYMLGEQTQQLTALGKLDLMEGVAQRVTSYFDNLQNTGIDRDGRRRRARALTQIGDTYGDRGRFDEATDFYRRALAERQALVAEKPNKSDHVSIAGIYGVFGYFEQQRGRASGALAHAIQASILFAALAVAYPDDAKVRRELMGAYLGLGEAQEIAGRLAEALEAYRNALVICEWLPDNVRRERDWPATLSRVAELEMRTGETASAIARYRRIAEQVTRAAAAAPDDMRRQEDLVHAFMKSASAAAAIVDLEGARAELAKALPVAERLVANDPSSEAWAAILYSTLDRSGENALDRGDLAAAKDVLARALATARARSARARRRESAAARGDRAPARRRGRARVRGRPRRAGRARGLDRGGEARPRARAEQRRSARVDRGGAGVARGRRHEAGTTRGRDRIVPGGDRDRRRARGGQSEGPRRAQHPRRAAPRDGQRARARRRRGAGRGADRARAGRRRAPGGPEPAPQRRGAQPLARRGGARAAQPRRRAAPPRRGDRRAHRARAGGIAHPPAPTAARGLSRGARRARPVASRYSSLPMASGCSARVTYSVTRRGSPSVGW